MTIWIILSSLVSAFLTGLGSYLISKRFVQANSNILIEQAKAKAKAIEHEAHTLLQESKMKAREYELELKEKHEVEITRKIREYENNIIEFEKNKTKQQEQLENQWNRIESEKHLLKQKQHVFLQESLSLQKIKQSYQEALHEITQILSNFCNLSKQEAKNILFKKIYEESKQEIAKFIKSYETQAKHETKQRANFLLAQATSRFAGEFAAERLIHNISLPNDEIKAKIIGKEGRNIKTLEMICGVDIIIDDTPSVITISSHNLYRRAIAVKTIEELIEDGRIQPARIEEIYKKCYESFEENVLKEGKEIVLDLELGDMHPEIIKCIGKLRYRASFGQNALAHSLEVANLAGIIAAELGGDPRLAIRAGLLHDIGKSLTHEAKGSHVELGAEICQRYNEHPIVLNAILCHHGHEEAKSIEAASVCAADALSAARPGARREVLEHYLTRVKQIEEIALAKIGVLYAYAINAGRELRVIVKSEELNDDESYLLAKEIAQDIELNVQYPGEIKINVIRETRNYAIAH